MGLLAWLKGLFGGGEPQGLPDVDPETFVFLVIRDARGPMERGEAYEEPIDEALMAAELGEVTGAGSQLGDERPDGTRPIEWCGVDLMLYDAAARQQVRQLLQDKLRELDAPEGTEIQYTESGERLLDRLGASGWETRLPRTDVHPGFGC